MVDVHVHGAIATRRAHDGASGRVSFRDVLAFENFVLLMVVIFGLQVVERSFGPVLLAACHASSGTRGAAAVLGRRAVLGAGRVRRARPSARGGTAASGHARAVIVGVAAGGGGGAGGCSRWREVAWLMTGRLLAAFGAAIGTALTTAFTAAGSVVPRHAHGVGFGFLTERVADWLRDQPGLERAGRRRGASRSCFSPALRAAARWSVAWCGG